MCFILPTNCLSTPSMVTVHCWPQRTKGRTAAGANQDLGQVDQLDDRSAAGQPLAEFGMQPDHRAGKRGLDGGLVQLIGEAVDQCLLGVEAVAGLGQALFGGCVFGGDLAKLGLVGCV